MSKRKTQLEALRKDIAFLMDDMTYKLADIILRLGNLIEKEDKFSLNILKSIRRMSKKRRDSWQNIYRLLIYTTKNL